MRLIAFVVTLACAAIPACAAGDSIHIKYFVSYPVTDRSSESTDVEITRRRGVTPPGYEATLDQGVDRYFDAVSKILAGLKAAAEWQRSVVHGPFVRVEIDLDGKKIILGSSYTRGGYLDSFPDSDGTSERHRSALAAILKLTAERLQETMPK